MSKIGAFPNQDVSVTFVPSPIWLGQKQTSVPPQFNSGQPQEAFSNTITNFLRDSITTGKQFCETGVPIGKPNNATVALLMFGHAFRAKYLNCSQRKKELHYCTDGTYETQKLLVEKHLENVVQPLESHGFSVDIFLTMYEQPECPGNYMQDLQQWYGRRVKLIRRSPDDHHPNNQWRNRLNTLHMLREHSTHSGGYEFVVMTRYDFMINPKDRWFHQHQQPAGEQHNNSDNKNWSYAAKLRLTAFSYCDDQRIELPWGLLNCMIASWEDCEQDGPADAQGRNCRAPPFEYTTKSFPPGSGLGLQMQMLSHLPQNVDDVQIAFDNCGGAGVNLGAVCDKKVCECDLYPAYMNDC